MAYTLQQSINWIDGYIQGMPVSAWTGLEPVLSSASMIRATALVAPFIWNFNRASTMPQFPITTVKGQQDYPVLLTDFGFIEMAVVSDGKTSWELKEVYNTAPLASSLAVTSTTQARPMSIAAQSQVPGVSVVFRLSAVPDTVYSVDVIYQKSPLVFVTLSDTWAPFPDSYMFIYNNLLLGEMLADADDVRAQTYRQKGVASLLSRAEGLSETDKAVFASQYIAQGIAMAIPGQKTQQATQARGI